MKRTSYMFIISFLATGSLFNSAECVIDLMGQISILADGGTKDAVLAVASLVQDEGVFGNRSVSSPLKKMFGSMEAFRAELAEFKKGQGSGSNCLTPRQVQEEISKAGLPTVSIKDKKGAAQELIKHFEANGTGGKLLKALGADNGEIASVKQALTKATAKA